MDSYVNKYVAWIKLTPDEFSRWLEQLRENSEDKDQWRYYKLPKEGPQTIGEIDALVIKYSVPLTTQASSQ